MNGTCKYETKIIDLIKKVRNSTGEEKLRYQKELDRITTEINNALKTKIESRNNQLETIVDKLEDMYTKIKTTVKKDMSSTYKERIKDIILQRIKSVFNVVANVKNQLSCVKLVLFPSVESKYRSYLTKVENLVKNIVSDLRKVGVVLNPVKVEAILIDFEINLLKEEIKHKIIDDMIDEGG